MSNELIQELKAFIIESLNLEEVTPEDIEDESPFVGEGLGLDSIDLLELGVALQRRYGLKISAESDEARQVFASIKALADYVAANRSN